MNLNEQRMKKRNDDVDDERSFGEKNRFKKFNILYKMNSNEQTMKKRNDDVDDERSYGEKNRLEKFNIVYKMNSNEQTMKKRNDDVDDERSYGEKNRLKKFNIIYKMNSNEQTMKKRNDDVDDERSYSEKNRLKKFNIIYKMNSNEQTMKKRNDDVDAGASLLDSMVPDINVPIMKSSKRNRFNFQKWIDNAKTKLSENVKRKSLQIANWILNTRIVKSHLSPKIKELIKMVMETKYSEKPIIREEKFTNS